MTIGTFDGPWDRRDGVGQGARRLASAAVAWLETRLDAERGRWFLWLPVLYGAGIAAYLGASSEPPFVVCLAMLIVAATLRQLLRFSALRLIASTTLLMLAAGFFTGKVRALIVDAPVLTRSIGAATLIGRIEDAERHQKAFRLIVRLESIEGNYQGAMPRRVRLRYHAKTPLPPVGSQIKLRASLRPPPEPVMPGGFDFARHYWFQGLGATGFALGKIEVLSADPPPWDMRLGSMVANLRQAIAARIGAVLSGETGGLAQALIMGERANISDETRLALTHAGIWHVVSISGFHMALTAGSAFWLIRALLAAVPGLALAFPIKIWAAVAALIVASAYLMISGSAVAAVRSYIMIVIMFAAITVNRPALSLRNLAIAAFLILAVTPESLNDPGFQMSFAATAALIAVYEQGLTRFGPPRTWPVLILLLAHALIGDVVTSIAASLAADPIAAYHFHQIAAYSVLGNMLAMPPISLVVMPMALLTLIAMPFGLEAWPLIAMGAGIDAMLAIAAWVSRLPGAVILLAAFDLTPLLLMLFGGLWLLIWRTGWRLAGLVPIAAGLALAPFAARPDIWIDREGQVIAVRLKDGSLSAPKSRKGEFSLKAWLEADGDGRAPRDVAKGAGFQCDEQSCLALVGGRIVSHVFHPGALADDCRRAVILIATMPVTEPCPGPDVIIDARELWEKGAQTIILGRGPGAAFAPGGGSPGANPGMPSRGAPEVDVTASYGPARGSGADLNLGSAPNPGAAPSSGSEPDEAQSIGRLTGEPGIRTQTVAETRGTRPWVIPRHRSEMIAAAPPDPRGTGKSGKAKDDPSGLEALDAASQ
jgi:competence protein ComEC